MGWERVSLADAMIARMTRDEVEDLCFRFHVDDETLDSRTKNSLVRSLIKYMEQRGQFALLTRELAALRPDIQPPHALGDRMTDTEGVTMVYVPAGTFTMGSTKDKVEKPPHEVTIARGFWLDLTPVTNAMYARFVKDGGYRKPVLWTPEGWEWVQAGQEAKPFQMVQANEEAGPYDYQEFTEPDQPRVGVTWFEAYAYCYWRGGRLPTEAEWEWAARGPENCEYPWGNGFDPSRVVFRDNATCKTAVVNAQTRLEGASWVGALDMSGNVWEWASTLYKPYPYDATDGRESPEDGEKVRIYRGGSWSTVNVHLLRAAYRSGREPSHEDFYVGFRCARSS